MKVNVTQRDIECGVKNSNTDCPIARSLSRHKYYYPDPFVDYFEVDLVRRDDGMPVRFNLPAIAHNFIVAFDNGQKVEPIKFELTNGIDKF